MFFIVPGRFSLFFMVPCWFSWFFMVQGWFFMVPGRFSGFVVVPVWFSMVPGGFLMHFAYLRRMDSPPPSFFLGHLFSILSPSTSLTPAPPPEI